MSKHTPGPWKATRTDGSYVVCSITGGWSVVALNADPNRYDAEADARLIAAAPELLRAAEIVEDRIAYFDSFHGGVIPEIEDWRYMDNSADMADLRRAIAKAKGDQA